MSNGIGKRQNEDNSMAMLAAQRQIYNEVSSIETFRFVLSVVLPIILAVVMNHNIATATIILYKIKNAMVFIPLLLIKTRDKKKNLAASIQLRFDTYVYEMPWDNVLFGEKTNINYVIVEKSRHLLAKDRNAFKDWYSITADDMTIEKGIFACQKENYTWDLGLRKKYNGFLIVIIVAFVLFIFSVGIVKNEPFKEWLARVVFIIPVLTWFIKQSLDLKDDMERLKELDRVISSPDKREMKDLQYLQKCITEHRRNALKIPNWFYSVFKGRFEDIENKLASLDKDL